MADANLLEILSNESKLDNMVVYGNVRCAIKKPSYLSNSIGITDGFFALVDVLALKCNGVDYCSKYSSYPDSKNIYFSKGSLVIVLNDKNYIGKNVKVYGRTLKGCTIKKQISTGARDGVVAFAWTKNNGQWCLIPNKVLPFGVSDARGTVLEDYVVGIVSGKPFEYPKSVESYIEYSGVEDVVPLELDSIKGCLEYSTKPIDLSSVPLNLVHRLNVSEKSLYADAVGEAANALKTKSKGYSKTIVSMIGNKLTAEDKDLKLEDRVDALSLDIVLRFIQNICSRYNFAISSDTKLKGKDIVDDLLDNLVSVHFREPSDETTEKENKQSSVDRFKTIESLKVSVALDPNVLDPNRVLDIKELTDTMKYATLVIGEVTGIGIEDLVGNYNSAYTFNELSLEGWFWCLARNPYLCGLLGNHLSVVDCDKIFCVVSEKYDLEECIKYRDMLLMLDNIKNASSRSTLINKRELTRMKENYNQKAKDLVDKFGVPMSKDCLIASSLVVENVNKLPENLGLSQEPSDILGNLNELGLIEEVNDGVILTRDLYKEYVVYETLYNMGEDWTGIEDDDIDSTISKFESSRGFSLENLQKDGVKLVKYHAGVLSGCAGSGKTTTSDCLVECIKEYLPEYELRFGAPTGKAARRLAEVVGGGVKTIHSMFGLGLDSDPYIVSKDRFIRKNEEGTSYAYILDEMAMSNMNLMYEIVNHLNEDDLVYFLGDIKQLSPIGKGTPFRSLMKYLPCVELGVSKRAAANGKINYNCGLINFVSDDNVVELQEGDDFGIFPCADADIQRGVVETFKKELSSYDEDDIQVVTGYQTDKYPWSTVQLNPMLQNLLRNDTDLLFVYNEGKYMRGDRVIHVKRNAYDMPRFRMKSTGYFEEVVTSGIVNGELGKLVGYINSEDCTIIPYEDKDYSKEEWNALDSNMRELINKRRNSSVEIRNETSYKDENMFFVIVQVYDVDLNEDVYVLYHANYHEKVSNEFYAKVFTGGDLKYLDLAYALTTHKMQGSQSKCIIIPLGSSGSASFMNRNMINTMITRASKKVDLIGSVKGRDSALTNGRRLTNIEEGEDVLGLLADC